MNIAGWIFMVISWGLILSLLIFCFDKVFSSQKRKPR